MTADEVEAAIFGAYREQLAFPPTWSAEQQDRFIAEHAGAATAWTLDQLDNIVDDVLERGRRHRWFPSTIASQIGTAQQQLIRDATRDVASGITIPADPD